MTEAEYELKNREEVSKKVNELIKFCESRFEGPITHEVFKGYMKVDNEVISVANYAKAYDVKGNCVRSCSVRIEEIKNVR